MIDDTHFAQIRRLFFAEHWTIGTIAKSLGVHHDAVERAIGSAAFNQRKAPPVRASVLDPYKAFVTETLARYPRLRATRVLEMLRGRGYTGSVVQLRRYLATVRTTPITEAFLRRTTLPGEEAQVDWAHFGTLQVGRARRPLLCFVMTLGHCRGLFARFFHDQTTTSFLVGHVLGFESFQGVTRRVLYDNLKSAVIERIGDAVRFSDDLLALAAHYHFEPRACAPYRGNEKGKVERAIQYLRHSFFAARSFSDLQDINGQLTHWIDAVAHRRLAPGDARGRTVATILDEERSHLLALPPARPPIERAVELRSGKTPHLRFDLNDYSIPHTLTGRPLVLRASDDAVRIFDDAGHLVAQHARSFGAGECVEDPAHSADLRRHKRHARELGGRQEIERLCPSAPRLFQALLGRGAAMAKEARSLLLLCDRYGPAVVEKALAHILDQGLASAHAVERRIDELRRATGQPPRPALASHDPATPRASSVDLADYDHLAAPKDRNP